MNQRRRVTPSTWSWLFQQFAFSVSTSLFSSSSTSHFEPTLRRPVSSFLPPRQFLNLCWSDLAFVSSLALLTYALENDGSKSRLWMLRKGLKISWRLSIQSHLSPETSIEARKRESAVRRKVTIQSQTQICLRTKCTFTTVQVTCQVSSMRSSMEALGRCLWGTTWATCET